MNVILYNKNSVLGIYFLSIISNRHINHVLFILPRKPIRLCSTIYNMLTLVNDLPRMYRQINTKISKQLKSKLFKIYLDG